MILITPIHLFYWYLSLTLVFVCNYSLTLSYYYLGALIHKHFPTDNITANNYLDYQGYRVILKSAKVVGCSSATWLYLIFIVLLFWCRITVLLTLIFFLYLFTLLLAFGLTVTILYSEIQMNFFVRYEFWLRFNCYSFRKINFLLSNCFTLEFYTNLPQVPGGWSRWFYSS